MRTLLFDIDGTLLVTHNSGCEALKQAIEKEFEPILDGGEARIEIDFGGRTDRSIIAELLDQNDIEPTATNHQRLQACYADLLPGALRQSGGTVLPGVKALLEQISQLSLFVSHVMTGNLVETAKTKLDHFGLLGHFRDIFGGDHDAHRDDLARRTARSLAQSPNHLAADDVVVIGDTVADINCAKAIGAKVIAVATGSHHQDRLAAAQPDAIVKDLSDTDRLIRLLREL